MQRTLFVIPHEIAGVPVFGFGWVLMFAAIALVVRVVSGRRQGHSLGDMIKSEGLIWLVMFVLIVKVARFVEIENVDGEPLGMAIRGYGVMLLTAVSSAAGLAYYRARRAGIDPEVILSLAPWAFIGGIVGARIFFVIQYRDKFYGETMSETLTNMLRFTEGGLVVYGAFIGGFLIGAMYLWRRGLPVLKIGDVIVPCVFLGVFFGRMGCLMNGCCYGGRCEDTWYAVSFPPNSPVYQEQIRSGELLGFLYNSETRRIESVREGSPADEAGIEVGSRLQLLSDDQSPLPEEARQLAREDVRRGVIAEIDGKRYRWTVDELPDQALPVVAAQLLSSVSGLVVCLLLAAIPMGKFRAGSIMMVGFASYAVLRFGLELVRVDESGQFGTDKSISQWVSVVVLAGSVIGLLWIYRPGASVSSAPVPDKG